MPARKVASSSCRLRSARLLHHQTSAPTTTAVARIANAIQPHGVCSTIPRLCDDATAAPAAAAAAGFTVVEVTVVAGRVSVVAGRVSVATGSVWVSVTVTILAGRVSVIAGRVSVTVTGGTAGSLDRRLESTPSSASRPAAETSSTGGSRSEASTCAEWRARRRHRCRSRPSQARRPRRATRPRHSRCRREVASQSPARASLPRSLPNIVLRG